MSKTIKLHETFTSFKEFESTLEKWTTENNVFFVRGSSTSVAKFNSKLEPHQKKFSDGIKYKYATYNCKSGAPRKSESTGMRPNLRSLKIGCTASFSLCAEYGNPQTLRISRFNNSHNHETTKDFAKFYPENRRLDEAQREQVELMTSAKGKPMAIRDQLRKCGKAVTKQDLANLTRQIRKKVRKGNSDVEDALGELEHMLQNDEGSSACVGYSEEENVIDFLFFQTSKMKKVFEQFPEVIGMDTTYKVNKNDMHLIVIICIDNHGNGRVVGYCFVRRETGDIVEEAILRFKEANENVTDKIRTVIVDKDYTEIGGVRKVLPHVHVHLCHAHVMRTFRKNTRKEKDQKKVMKILRQISECGSLNEFDSLYQDLIKEASADFMKYFDDNWKNIREAWILFVRDKSLSLGTRTTNYVESHNSKIKDVTDRSKSLGDCIRGLLKLHENTEFQSEYKDYLERATRSYIANVDDEDVRAIMETFTDWPAKLLYEEWRQSKANEESETTTTDESCTCHFFASFGIMHCRHIFKLRYMRGDPILKVETVPKRWLKPPAVPRQRLVTEEVEPKHIPTMNIVKRATPKDPKPKTERMRYNEALKLCSIITGLIAPTGGQQYVKRIQLLKDIINIWQTRREAKVLPLSKDGTYSQDTGPRKEIGGEESDGSSIVEVIEEDDPPSEKNKSQDEKESDADVHPENEGFVDDKEDYLEETMKFICSRCHSPLLRKLTVSNKHGNKDRYFHICPKGCVGSFRWDKCEFCGTWNVRVGHACETKPTDGSRSCPTVDILPSPTSKTTQQKSPQDNSDDELGSFDIGIDELINSSQSEESDSLEEVSGGESGSSNITGNSEEGTLDEFDSSQKISDASEDLFAEECDASVITKVGSGEAHDAASKISDASYDSQISQADVSSHTIEAEDQIEQDFTQNAVDEEREGSTRQVSDINRLKRGLAIADNKVQATGTDTWTVTSKNDDGVVYKIFKKLELCCRDPCMTLAHPCRHRYVCTCPDRQNPCKHIYKVHSIDRPDEIIPISHNTQKNPETKKKPTVAQRLTLTNFQELKSILKLPPAQKVCGRPNRFKNVKSKSKSAAVEDENDIDNPDVVEQTSPRSHPETVPQKSPDGSGSQSLGQNHDEVILDGQHDNLSLERPTSPPVDEHERDQQTTEVECCVCSEDNTDTKCTGCGKRCHRMHNNKKCSYPFNTGDVCKKCICLTCSEPLSHDHVCRCIVCEQEAKTYRICQECRFPVHKECTMVSDDGYFICQICHLENTNTGPPQPDAIVPSKLKDKGLCAGCLENVKADHVCTCQVCQLPAYDWKQCRNCSRATHLLCMVDPDDAFSECKSCASAKVCGLRLNVLQMIIDGEKLLDIHMCAANTIMRSQYPHIKGLRPPMGSETDVENAVLGEMNVFQYDVADRQHHYIQFIYTGYEHWITAIVEKGPSRVMQVCNSSGATTIGSFVEQQLALIIKCQGKQFKVAYPHVYKMDGAISDFQVDQCAPLAIAYAVEFAETEKVKYVYFDLVQIREHLHKCLINGKFTRFPRSESPAVPVKNITSDFVKVYCTCRQPEHFDKNMITCSNPKCPVKHFHWKCEGIAEPPTARAWRCSKCQTPRIPANSGKKTTG